MPNPINPAKPNRRLLAELSALADGTLEPARAAAIRKLIAVSPELQERYQRERLAVSSLHELRAERAPAALRSAMEARQRRIPGRRPRLYAGALAATVGVVVALLVLLLPEGSPGSPSVSQAAALALRGPASPPPAPNHANPARLEIDVQDVYFPNWSRKWRAVGQRTDRLDGQLAVTVYYVHGARTVAYTIVGVPALHWPGAETRHVDGIMLQSFVDQGRLVITWRRAGHTCVLSGNGVGITQLAKLAAWEAPGLDT